MTEHGFTPGKWMRDGRTIYALDENGFVNRFSARVEGGYVQQNPRRSYRDAIRTTEEELDAVAQLFFASPTLLEALFVAEKAIIGIWGAISRDDEAGARFADQDPAIATIRAAITLATGKDA